MKVNILGTDYKVAYSNEEKDNRLTEAAGMCDFTSKEILIDTTAMENIGKPGVVKNMDTYINKVLRHEMVHAFLFESGLEAVSRDEQLVDWIAVQVPKMFKTFEKAGVL